MQARKWNYFLSFSLIDFLKILSSLLKWDRLYIRTVFPNTNKWILTFKLHMGSFSLDSMKKKCVKNRCKYICRTLSNLSLTILMVMRESARFLTQFPNCPKQSRDRKITALGMLTKNSVWLKHVPRADSTSNWKGKLLSLTMCSFIFLKVIQTL